MPDPLLPTNSGQPSRPHSPTSTPSYSSSSLGRDRHQAGQGAVQDHGEIRLAEGEAGGHPHDQGAGDEKVEGIQRVAELGDGFPGVGTSDTMQRERRDAGRGAAAGRCRPPRDTLDDVSALVVQGEVETLGLLLLGDPQPDDDIDQLEQDEAHHAAVDECRRD
jgi:hypothetical protein